VRERGIYKRGTVYWINYTDGAGARQFERVGTDKRLAIRVRARRLAEIDAGKFSLRASGRAITFRDFVEARWGKEVAPGLKPTTRRGYEHMLRNHLLPAFGDRPLVAITRGLVKGFIATKTSEQRFDYSRGKHPKPGRPTRAPKSIKNMIACLGAILSSAELDYELIDQNPLRGVLARRRRFFPTEALRGTPARPPILEPEDLRRAVEAISDWRPRQMVLTAAFTGLRWGEQVALRIEDDIDFRRNKIHITRQFYKRVPQTPKTVPSVRDIDMSPLVRAIMKTVPWSEGLIFSPDGTAAIGEGSWIRRQWQRAQRRAGVRHPIRWHDLRHQFVSLLIAAGKDPLYISKQAGHSDPGFTLKRYGHLFETIKVTPVEWPEDLVWSTGCHASVTHRAVSSGIE